MNKKAQITLFVIIAIVLISGIVLFFVISNKSEGNSSGSRDYSNFDNYVQDCFEFTLAKVVYFNSFQGGYYSIEGDSISYEMGEEIYPDAFVPYYLINEKENFPSTEKLEEQISLGVESEFFKCLDFSSFDYDISYEYEKIDVDTNIKNNKISASLNLPFEIFQEKDSLYIEDFYAEEEFGFFALYEFSRYLAEEQKANGNNLCLSCLVEDSENRGCNLSLQSLITKDSYVLINTLVDENEGIVYNFAYKFSEEENE